MFRFQRAVRPLQIGELFFRQFGNVVEPPLRERADAFPCRFQPADLRAQADVDDLKPERAQAVHPQRAPAAQKARIS